MVLMFTASEGTPFSAIEIGCGAIRRPLRSVSVLPEPMPRRSIEATSPRASCGPLLISVMPEGLGRAEGFEQLGHRRGAARVEIGLVDHGDRQGGLGIDAADIRAGDGEGFQFHRLVRRSGGGRGGRSSLPDSQRGEGQASSGEEGFDSAHGGGGM
jgi:hypothetical protein